MLLGGSVRGGAGVRGVGVKTIPDTMSAAASAAKKVGADPHDVKSVATRYPTLLSDAAMTTAVAFVTLVTIHATLVWRSGYAAHACGLRDTPGVAHAVSLITNVSHKSKNASVGDPLMTTNADLRASLATPE